MAKFKAAGRGGKGKQTPSNARGLVPCLFLVITGLVLVGMLFYAMLKQSPR
jgi:hypothetical protein